MRKLKNYLAKLIAMSLLCVGGVITTNKVAAYNVSDGGTYSARINGTLNVGFVSKDKNGSLCPTISDEDKAKLASYNVEFYTEVVGENMGGWTEDGEYELDDDAYEGYSLGFRTVTGKTISKTGQEQIIVKLTDGLGNVARYRITLNFVAEPELKLAFKWQNEQNCAGTATFTVEKISYNNSAADAHKALMPEIKVNNLNNINESTLNLIPKDSLFIDPDSKKLKKGTYIYEIRQKTFTPEKNLEENEELQLDQSVYRLSIEVGEVASGLYGVSKVTVNKLMSDGSLQPVDLNTNNNVITFINELTVKRPLEIAPPEIEYVPSSTEIKEVKMQVAKTGELPSNINVHFSMLLFLAANVVLNYRKIKG